MGNTTNQKVSNAWEKCDLCNKPNHLAKVNRTRHQKQLQSSQQKQKVNAIEEPESESDTSDEGPTSIFINSLRIKGKTKQSIWLSTISSECENVSFKLDTGAEAIVKPAQEFNQLLNEA